MVNLKEMQGGTPLKAVSITGLEIMCRTMCR